MTFIKGVEILSTQEVIVSYSWKWDIIGIIGIFLGIIILLFSLWLAQIDENKFSTVIALLGTVLLLFGILNNKYQNPIKSTIYEVSISDSVSFNRIMSQYDVLEQNGKIYKIMVKRK